MAGNEEIPAQKNESSVSEDEEEETPNDKGSPKKFKTNFCIAC